MWAVRRTSFRVARPSCAGCSSPRSGEHRVYTEIIYQLRPHPMLKSKGSFAKEKHNCAMRLLATMSKVVSESPTAARAYSYPTAGVSAHGPRPGVILLYLKVVLVAVFERGS